MIDDENAYWMGLLGSSSNLDSIEQQLSIETAISSNDTNSTHFEFPPVEPAVPFSIETTSPTMICTPTTNPVDFIGWVQHDGSTYLGKNSLVSIEDNQIVSFNAEMYELPVAVDVWGSSAAKTTFATSSLGVEVESTGIISPPINQLGRKAVDSADDIRSIGSPTFNNVVEPHPTPSQIEDESTSNPSYSLDTSHPSYEYALLFPSEASTDNEQDWWVYDPRVNYDDKDRTNNPADGWSVHNGETLSPFTRDESSIESKPSLFQRFLQQKRANSNAGANEKSGSEQTDDGGQLSWSQYLAKVAELSSASTGPGPLLSSVAAGILTVLGHTAHSAVSAGESIVTVTSAAIERHTVIREATGLTIETCLFAAERIRAVTEEYIQRVTTDDPETQRLAAMRRGQCGQDWTQLLRLRSRFANLSWEQRQLIHETMDPPARDKQETLRLAGEPRLAAVNEDEFTAERLLRDNPLDASLFQYLVTEAEAGDAEAQFALARWFVPPRFARSAHCCVCHRSFGVSLFRHSCRNCGRSLCTDHSLQRRRVLHYGINVPVRVCDACARVIDREVAVDQLEWRKSRVQAFLRGQLLLYRRPVVDRGIDKAYRVADYSLQFVKNTLILSFPAKILVESMDILKRYGMAGLAGLLLRKDFVEAVETLKRISGMDQLFSMSLHELTACIYYKLAIDRGLRGCVPEDEHLSHTRHPKQQQYQEQQQVNIGQRETPTIDLDEYLLGQGIEGKKQDSETNGVSEEFPGEVSDADLDAALKFAPLAVNVVYQESAVECQRLAQLQGWSLVFHTNQSAPEQPAYALFAMSTQSAASDTTTAVSGRKEAVLAVRGTNSVHDIVTDIRAAPQRFPPPLQEVEEAINGDVPAIDTQVLYKRQEDREHVQDHTSKEQGDRAGQDALWEWLQVATDRDSTYACGGMARASLWLLAQTGPSLLTLYLQGYDIVITGHSLGGAVAAMLTRLLQAYIPSVRCLTFGCPSCLDRTLASELNARVLSVVLHDDIIPRVTPQSIRMLMRELMVFRVQVFRHLQQDWYDVINRAGSLWSPQWREIHASQVNAVLVDSDDDLLAGYFSSPNSASLTLGSEMEISGYCERTKIGADRFSEVIRIEQPIRTIVPSEIKQFSTYASPSTRSSLSSNDSIRQNGDDAKNHLKPLLILEDEDVDDENKAPKEDSSVSEGEPRPQSRSKLDIFTHVEEVVVVQEDKIPDLWIPGRVLHIYSHRGQYKVAMVPKDFPSLRKIEVQGHIFTDHFGPSIFEALLEAKAVRKATASPPPWVPFNISERCQCCNSKFTWHSTFQGEAQEHREKHNCRHCGGLVCGPCSSDKRAIPRFGLIFPVRICDTCVFKGDYTS